MNTDEEINKLREKLEKTEAELTEDVGVIAVWRHRTERAEADVVELLDVLYEIATNCEAIVAETGLSHFSRKDIAGAVMSRARAVIIRIGQNMDANGMHYCAVHGHNQTVPCLSANE